jgi:hypothetical protein
MNYKMMCSNYDIEGKQAIVLPQKQVYAIESVVLDPSTASMDLSRLFPALKRVEMSKELCGENGLNWWNRYYRSMIHANWVREVECRWHDKMVIMDMLGSAATGDMEVDDCYRVDREMTEWELLDCPGSPYAEEWSVGCSPYVLQSNGRIVIISEQACTLIAMEFTRAEADTNGHSTMTASSQLKLGYHSGERESARR